MPVPGSASTSETTAASIGSETAGDAAFASLASVAYLCPCSFNPYALSAYAGGSTESR
jgi:hypothetical protein